MMLKHPQHILAFDKQAFGYAEFTFDQPPGMVVNGFNLLSPKDFWERAIRSLFIGRRHELESDERFAQFLPYIILWRNNTGKKEVFVYTRTNKVGEERLAGNSSIGLGGHVDLLDVEVNEKSVIDLLMTAAKATARELNEELVFTTPTGIDVDFDHVRMHHVVFPKFAGYINDAENEVGRVHGGAVFSMEVPPGYNVACREEELITKGFMQVADIDGDTLEPWSKIVLENIAKVLV